ncbi:Ferredoxin [Methanolobus vulcani]|uniref:Ferredoxin n=1 Tax=Methanolobus vulcani TaxID=38026 RepID=A0A7Z7FD36_9EURY|nr:ferredoxin [Methanolobus vulcani]SDG05251.1 Ferredoxin [Methanolobus vulcani]
MAMKENKFDENIDGAYYVDADCIGCNLCVSNSPQNFKMKDDDSTAYVFKQPENEKEKQACENALAECPVDAIGNDG